MTLLEVITHPIVLFPLMVWSLFWKVWALWKAAQQRRVGWFIALLIIQTVGILDMLYIFVFSKPRSSRPGSRRGGGEDALINSYDPDIEL